MEKLSNDRLTIAVDAKGAELQSIKDSEGREYLWQADPNYWPRHSPILFPIVCGLWKDTFRIDGHEYKMKRHGFARDMEFRLLRKADDRVTFVLESDRCTMALFPYHFHLSVTYRLEDNKIHVVWHVYNHGRKEMHFQIGGHPAFYVPGIKEGEPIKGVMRFDEQGVVDRVFGDVEGCIRPGREELKTEDGLWPFSEESFKNDAVIIDQCQLHSVTLLNPDGSDAVSVNFNAPAVGIWTPYGKHAPFVCIEPWYGLHDTVAYQGEFRDKHLMNHLQPGSSFMSEYVIKIGE